jgi:hypothetical protein
LGIFDGAFISPLSLSLSLSQRYRRDYCSVTISNEEQWEINKEELHNSWCTQKHKKIHLY